MASEPLIRPVPDRLDISRELRELLHLRETDLHFAVRTLSGATLLRLKADIHYPWQLLEGIMDDGKDTSEEHRRERDWEFAHDERKFGIQQDR